MAVELHIAPRELLWCAEHRPDVFAAMLDRLWREAERRKQDELRARLRGHQWQ